MAAWDYVGNESAARILLRQLAAHWRPSQWPVRFWIVRDTVNGEPVFGIRSDLIAGMPAELWKKLTGTTETTHEQEAA